MSSLLGSKNDEILVALSCIVQVFERGFLQNIYHSHWGNERLKVGKFLHLNEYIGDETRELSVLLLCYLGREQYFSNVMGFCHTPSIYRVTLKKVTRRELL